MYPDKAVRNPPWGETRISNKLLILFLVKILSPKRQLETLVIN